MILKDTAFIKFLIELPEPQKRWATVVCCGILLVLQVRRYEIREIEKQNAADIKFEKMRSEKNVQLENKDLKIEMLQKDKYENMMIFKQLYLETEMLKLKVKTNDSLKKKI